MWADLCSVNPEWIYKLQKTEPQLQDELRKLENKLVENGTIRRRGSGEIIFTILHCDEFSFTHGHARSLSVLKKFEDRLSSMI